MTRTSTAEDRLRAERTARAGLRDARRHLRELEFDAGLRKRSWRERIIVPIVASVLAIAGAAFAVSEWVNAIDRYTDAEYESAAAQNVALLLGPDFRSTDNARRILDGATGEFREEFAQSADSYTQFVRSRGTVARADITGTGVSGRSGDTAAVLVSASVTFTGGAVPQQNAAPRNPATVDDLRLRVLVTPADGSLKLSAVQYLP